VNAFGSLCALAALPIAAFFSAGCGGLDPLAAKASSRADGAVAGSDHAPGQDDRSEPQLYRGPTLGAAKGFSVLAESAISALNSSWATGNLGVSGASVRHITGFDAVPAMKYGTDSSPPNGSRTILTQREVDALVDDIDLRACDFNYADLGRSARGITLHPGVTCLPEEDRAPSLSGRIILDAGGDANAFFIIRSNTALTVADETLLMLENGAQACAVYWRIAKQVTIGARVEFFGDVVADMGISMQSGSTLVGRALARTRAVVLDRNTITLPVYDTGSASASAATCTHFQ